MHSGRVASAAFFWPRLHRWAAPHVSYQSWWRSAADFSSRLRGRWGGGAALKDEAGKVELITVALVQQGLGADIS